ncbi:6-O-methylguanine DNA methyltransferase [Xenorhabdus sp. PB62.4]|nr:6-O-methylguanine DNA methyltransferase [Xenorhabdus sp. PB62.4]
MPSASANCSGFASMPSGLPKKEDIRRLNVNDPFSSAHQIVLRRTVRDQTNLQQRIWLALREIPVGTTVSYTDIAKRIGSPKAVRAVASA